MHAAGRAPGGPSIVDALNEDCVLHVAAILMRTPVSGPFAVMYLCCCCRRLRDACSAAHLNCRARRSLLQAWRARLTWRIPDFADLRSAWLMSPAFRDALGHNWRLMMLPTTGGVQFYLSPVAATATRCTRYWDVRFRLLISAAAWSAPTSRCILQEEGALTVMREGHGVYHLSSLAVPERGYCVAQDESLVVSVSVTVKPHTWRQRTLSIMHIMSRHALRDLRDDVRHFLSMFAESEIGAPIRSCYCTMQLLATPEQIDGAIEHLCREGEIYQTVDDEHWKLH